jgi:hypothetical protein
MEPKVSFTMKKQMVCGVVVMVGLLGAVGCGSDGGLTAREACEQSSAVLCERIYACFTAEEIAFLGYSSEAACAAELEQDAGCAQQTAANTCASNETYQPDQAGDCVDQLGGLSCSQFRDPEVLFNIEATAPACGKLCVVE